MSHSQDILLNIESKEVRFAHLKSGTLADLVVERKKARQLAGNIYKGKTTNILHNIQSAFIDINEGDNGFIHISDIIENTRKFEQMFDMDFDSESPKKPDDKKAEEKESNINIEELMKLDQFVLVQVVKEPIGSKGARLTSNISLPGRYLVLLPNSAHRGVSRKIEDRAARDRLKKMIRSFEMPQNMGLICRTASKNATVEQLISEAEELLQTWEEIRDKFNKATRPCCLYEESDLIRRAVMTAVDKKADRLLVDNYTVFQRCQRIYQQYESEHALKIECYRDHTPMFERFNVEREIEKALRRKVWLPSGGYLFLDRTEAMLTIDVNSGRSGSKDQATNVEEALVRINLEAAEEIARQLRIRNVGGLVVCDFIDMRFRKNQRRVLDKLRDCLKDDWAKCTVLGMSEFGLVEMTRQRNRESLIQTMFTECPYCSGNGIIKNHESMAIEIERALKKIIHVHKQYAIQLAVHPHVATFLDIEDKAYLTDLAEGFNAHLNIVSDDTLHLNDYKFSSSTSGKKIEV